jgi:hypothetical protein
MTTRAQKANQELGGEIGSYAGLAAGGAAGHYAPHAATRLKAGGQGAASSYKFSRELAGVSQKAGRLKDLGTAARTGATAARHAPKYRGFVSPAGLGIGAAGGMIGGYHAGKKAVAAHQQRKKVGKSMDEISKVGYVPNPEKINSPSGKKHRAAGAATMVSSAAGGGLMGHKAGELGALKYYRGGGGGAGKLASAIGHGFKAMPKTKMGAAGIGLSAAGIGGSMGVRHSAKKKGIIVEAKKNHTVSAFGVDHGY